VGAERSVVRADARENRARLLDCATSLILDVGGEPTRDALAHSARVGIGTVYRHFPDQQTLLHKVARHVLEKTIATGEQIVASDANGSEAIRRSLHEAIDHGIGVVNIVHPLLDDHDWPDLQCRADAMLAALLERARGDRELRADLTVGDIVFATIRFGRPLAIGQHPSEDREIAHRQLDRYVDGLCSAPRSSRGTSR
jgi:AcrR family transcriptional regulator